MVGTSGSERPALGGHDRENLQLAGLHLAAHRMRKLDGITHVLAHQRGHDLRGGSKVMCWASMPARWRSNSAVMCWVDPMVTLP